MHFRICTALAFVASVALTACGGGSQQADAVPASGSSSSGSLSAEQLEKGIGPVRDIELVALDDALAARGQEIFTMKCSACHKPEERYVGPALGDITTRRAPEFVMNMILNPAEMLAQHPEAKKLLAEFMTPMPNQSLTEDDARAVLEYLRTLADANQPMED